MRTLTRLLAASLGIVTLPTGLASQETEVRQAVIGSFAALEAGDVEAYLAHFLPRARVFVEGDGILELAPADWFLRIGPGTGTWATREIRVQVIGSRAVTVAEVEGALRIDGVLDLQGPWRYAETRLLERGRWKILQQELSALGERAPPPRQAASGQPIGDVRGAGGPAPPTEASGEASRVGLGSMGRGTRAAPAADQPIVTDVEIFGPPPPLPPEVITRDEQGSATVRAIRLDGPLDIDGNLDEPVYSEVPPLDGFIQSLPDEGEPVTELTEAWVMFDDRNVYVSARMHDRAPESEWVANEMRRDLIRTNDNFGLIFDTFYDRRNGYFFYVNPLGAFSDIQVTNEGSPNFDWNPVWDVRAGRFDGGWTVEMQFPFKSLRYRPGASQVWGLQLRRMIRRRNETAQLTLIPRESAGALGNQAILRLSRAATLVGLEAPPPGLNLDAKPYGIAGLTTDRTAAPATSNELDADGGVDIKWGVTQSLAADFTYNTDFAQVEVDEQQVNLTRFSLFFPEKREFFLESRDVFSFPTTGGRGGFRGQGSAPTLFFSRRIGLQQGRRVPILGGGRLTGKLGPLDLGALSIRTGDVQEVDSLGNDVTLAEVTNFTAVRLRADVLDRSNVGALFTRRSESLAGDAWSQTYGADASFAFLENFYLSGYYALTETPGLAAPGARFGRSYQAGSSWEGDLLGFATSHLLVEDDFNPEVGFLRRSGFRQSQLSLRASPRPSARAVRQVTLQGGADYLESAREGYVESREISGRLTVELENSDQIGVGYAESYENLLTEERITGARIPAGRYAFDAIEASYQFGPQRFFSGTLSGRYGTFYDGRLTSLGFSRGRIEVMRQLSLEPSVSLNWVDLPGQRFTTTLALTRLSYTFSPRMFFSTLLQYNSSADAFSANARLRWEYAPGSEIFLVYTEERDTFDFERFPVLANRGLVLKVTRLLRL